MYTYILEMLWEQIICLLSLSVLYTLIQSKHNKKNELYFDKDGVHRKLLGKLK